MLLDGLIGDGFGGDGSPVGDPLDLYLRLRSDCFGEGGGDDVFFTQRDLCPFQDIGYGAFQNGNVPGGSGGGKVLDLQAPCRR